MDIWFIAWIVTYLMFLGLAYVAYVSKIVKRITKPDYHHYQILDTGESGDFDFKPGINYINGIARTFIRERLFHGTVYYMYNNAEPANMSFEVGKCKYWFDTKETDTNRHQDILETLLRLRFKDIMIILIIGCAVVLLLAIVGTAWYNHNAIDSMQTTLATIANNTAPKIVQVR